VSGVRSHCKYIVKESGFVLQRAAERHVWALRDSTYTETGSFLWGAHSGSPLKKELARGWFWITTAGVLKRWLIRFSDWLDETDNS
jgi:hypothetical protein